MRSRRTLARPALAVAAVLIPAALLSGTVATASYATESPSPSASASSESASPSPSPSGSASASPSASVSPSVSASPSVSVSPTGPQCPSKPGKDDKILSLTMSGKTRKFVPGGPWSGVTLKMENRSDTALKDVVVRLGKLAYDEAPDALLEQQQYVNVQRWDAQSRTWAEIPWSESEMVGPLPSLDLAAQETATVALRISVEADWPHGRFPDFEDTAIGSGWLDPIPTGISDEGVCGYGETWSFSIIKSDTDTGDGDGDGDGATSPPTSGTDGNTPSPQTGSSTAPVTPDTTPTGDLAHTGSPSALPVIAGVGAVAVGLGAGAVYVVRRRRSGTGTHA